MKPGAVQILNNKLKHVGSVDRQLATYPSFANSLGVGLNKIAFPLQSYVDGVFEFVGNVMEAMDAIIFKMIGKSE